MTLKNKKEHAGIGWDIAAIAMIIYLVVLFLFVNAAIFLGLFRIIQWLFLMVL